MTFIPAWAEETLARKDPHDMAEIALLREFYGAWIDYHSLPKNKSTKEKQSALADLLLERHNALQLMKNPVSGTLTLNGVKLNG